MDQTFTDAPIAAVVPASPSTRARSRALHSLLTFLFLALIAFLAVYRLNPPAAVPENAPPTEFSSARAMSHIGSIARAPHPLGSAEHAAVRDYIAKALSGLGLEPQVQKTTVVSQRFGGPLAAATVENIVVRLKGTESGKALMLVGHYDSVPTGPGASDDGSAVAALIETARALKAGPPLKNDVIFLFSDGEELGLLGAKAFVDEHPWAKDVGAVFNFEARGNSGPVIMFETSKPNGKLIGEFGKAAPHPIASSFSDAIYQSLPNDTDMTIFKDAGWSGLNFAYLGGLTHYHNQLDNQAQLDQRSLQHDGSYALALARHFGNLQLENLKAGNSVYFDVLGLWLVRYPASLVFPLSILAALVFAGVIWFGWRRKQLTLKGILLGAGVLLLNSVLALLLVTLVWKIHRLIHNALGIPSQADSYRTGLYLVSFIALTFALVFASYVFLRKVRTTDLTAGALFVWLLLLFVSAVIAPGASYLLLWPLLFSLLALAYVFAARDDEQSSWGHLGVLTLSAIPALLLIVPIVILIFSALALNAYLIVSICVVLLSGLLIPHLRQMSATKRWLAPGLAALIGICAMTAGAGLTTFDGNHPRQSHLLYGLDTDISRAVWASSDPKPNQWTSQFLGEDFRRGAISDYILSGYSGFISSPAPVAQLSAPQLTMLGDQMQSNGVRTLRFRVNSTRQAPILTVGMLSATDVVNASLNGKRDQSQTLPRAEARRWSVNYFSAPPEGIELALEVLGSEPIKIRVQDESYGLPELPGHAFQPRPAGIIPSPVPHSDTTMVGKTFTLGAPTEQIANQPK